MNEDLECFNGGLNEELTDKFHHIAWNAYRLKVIGGWIVYRDVVVAEDIMTKHSLSFNSTAIFISDQNHEWEINYKD